MKIQMNECQMCHQFYESSAWLICKDCWIEMIREAKSSGQDFYEYWEIDGE